MKKSWLGAALVLTLPLASTAMSACDSGVAAGTTSTSTTGTGGAGGSGGSGGGEATVACGAEACKGSSLTVAGIVLAFPACCPKDAPTVCGVDTTVVSDLVETWTYTCLELDQAGPVDPTCPTLELKDPGTGDMIPLVGCCLPNVMCGVVLDFTPLAGPNFGCMDPTPFLDGEVSPPCGGTGTGGGGTGGMGTGGAMGTGGMGGMGTGGMGTGGNP